METYKAFLDRIGSFEKEELWLGEGHFRGSAAIAQKVDENNRFRPFYGDTVVFNLDDGMKKEVEGIVDRVYAAAAECFCERLRPDTFHMTLHDLSNSPVWEAIATEVCENERAAAKIAERICAQKIRMRSKFIFNMVNTSLVLGLYPADEEAYRKLMRLYHLFEDIKKLSYPLTPHITLGYYNIHGFNAQSARKLEAVVKELNKNVLEVELDTRNLFYQRFVSMDDYTSIFALVSGR